MNPRTLILTGLLSPGLLVALRPCALASVTWYVNGVSGSDSNNCLSPSTACQTIGHAISVAESGGTIMIAAATYSEHLTIGINLTLAGSSVDATIIDGGGTGTVVRVSSGTNVALSKLTIQNGAMGIANVGTLQISNSIIQNNFLHPICISYCFVSGAGIRNVTGLITIRNSTIANNRIYVSCSGTGIYNQCAAYGGGVSNEGGEITIVNSTLSGNSVVLKKNGVPGGCCGAIFESNASLAIYSSTIVGNSATTIGGIPGVTTVINNSIVANNVGGNCSSSMISKGYNLSSDNSCIFSGPGDLNNTDPKLGTLGSYGRPTQTIPLLSGSPAIDAGNPNGCTDGSGNLLKTDQRGMPRPDKEDSVGCDIGAYENQSD